ncbi:MAG: hypothetical protein CSA22_08565 [Deltaproteobacteria bacterium]|nr:MAG: hypothetical protein CSA22_08565 [Deltaproteobacteria bacterium]
MNRNHGADMPASLPRPSLNDLRGRQSVRATFKLTSRAIDAIRVVSVHLGIKKKSLFDHLIEDPDALSSIADTVDSGDFCQLKRVQKTFVLSRSTLDLLDRISKGRNTPRDALVEYSIRRLHDIIETEKIRHRTRKALLAEGHPQLIQTEQLFRDALDRLGPDDPVTRHFQSLAECARATFSAVADYVEKGEVIESF